MVLGNFLSINSGVFLGFGGFDRFGRGLPVGAVLTWGGRAEFGSNFRGSVTGVAFVSAIGVGNEGEVGVAFAFGAFATRARGSTLRIEFDPILDFKFFVVRLHHGSVLLGCVRLAGVGVVWFEVMRASAKALRKGIGL